MIGYCGFEVEFDFEFVFNGVFLINIDKFGVFE